MGEGTEFTGFSSKTLGFLRGLGENNTKIWFEAHREDYENFYLAPAKLFVADLGPKLRKISPALQFEARVNGSLFRINRDLRFSKDKSPYKDHLDLWFWTGERRGWGSPGFYFRLTAESLMLGAGMHRFEKPQLKAYREAVVADRPGKELAALLKKMTQSGIYAAGGSSRKKVPRGFDPEHPRAALLLHDGLTVGLETPIPAAAFSPDLVAHCLEHYRATWPLNRWLMKHLG